MTSAREAQWTRCCPVKLRRGDEIRRSDARLMRSAGNFFGVWRTVSVGKPTRGPTRGRQDRGPMQQADHAVEARLQAGIQLLASMGSDARCEGALLPCLPKSLPRGWGPCATAHLRKLNAYSPRYRFLQNRGAPRTFIACQQTSTVGDLGRRALRKSEMWAPSLV